jgi:hypothetical protein
MPAIADASAAGRVVLGNLTLDHVAFEVLDGAPNINDTLTSPLRRSTFIPFRQNQKARINITNRLALLVAFERQAQVQSCKTNGAIANRC